MHDDPTFDSICAFLKEQGSDSKLLEAMDPILGMVLVGSAAVVAFNPALAPGLIGLIGAKGELVKAGHYLLKKITGAKEENYQQFPPTSE